MLPRRFPLALLIVTLGSCATPAPEAPPAPRPISAPQPFQPAPAAPPRAVDWRDWPVNAGNWTYVTDGLGSMARFGSGGGMPELVLRCEARTRTIQMVRNGPIGGKTDLTIRTSTTMRTLQAQPAARSDVMVTFAANDPLLDAIAYSRGRFVVQQAGAPPLVVPTWTEIDRVIQDCRG